MGIFKISLQSEFGERGKGITDNPIRIVILPLVEKFQILWFKSSQTDLVILHDLILIVNALL